MILNNFKNRIFGRTRGRIKKFDIEKYTSLVNKYKFKKLNSQKNYILDIGTGYGETSIFLSKKFPKKNIISCDKYIDGNFNLLKNIQKEKISNISIYPGNVYEILENNSTGEYFDLIWIFFPDPWPKKKHFKRRLITSSFLKKLYQFIKKNGELCIVTDSTSYSRFILKNIHNSKNQYLWINQNEFYLDLKDYYDLETKFYKKAIISGRKPSLFILKKI